MIEIGPPETEVSVDRPETVTLRFLVSTTVTDEAKASIRELRKAGGDDLLNPSYQRIEELLNSLSLVLTVVLRDGSQYVTKQKGFHNYRSPLTFPQFRGHLVKPPPSSLRTRSGSHSRGSSDGASDYRTPQCTQRYPVSRRHGLHSADGTRARA